MELWLPLPQSLNTGFETDSMRRTFDELKRGQTPFWVFRRLENPAYFLLARVDYGTVIWPGDIDIALETLYDRSMPLAS